MSVTRIRRWIRRHEIALWIASVVLLWMIVSVAVPVLVYEGDEDREPICLRYANVPTYDAHGEIVATEWLCVQWTT